ncbi:hypothetical protein NHQ30_009331 [Ciborinia camelliae]|nr:hypothetical protein NHQ30_009331 [Ciborinia camelliae]
MLNQRSHKIQKPRKAATRMMLKRSLSYLTSCLTNPSQNPVPNHPTERRDSVISSFFENESRRRPSQFSTGRIIEIREYTEEILPRIHHANPTQTGVHRHRHLESDPYPNIAEIIDSPPSHTSEIKEPETHITIAPTPTYKNEEQKRNEQIWFIKRSISKLTDEMQEIREEQNRNEEDLFQRLIGKLTPTKEKREEKLRFRRRRRFRFRYLDAVKRIVRNGWGVHPTPIPLESQRGRKRKSDELSC